MRSTLLTLLFFCLIPFTSKAQKLEFEGEFLLFREAKTKQPVLIVNDSLVYKGFAMNKIAFKHTEYPAKLQEYKFFNIGNKTYLVHEGCGPVLEYRNDSIVRIDNSFLHRNQFGAARFVYKKEIYFFGGYGLFTFKSILTKFDFQTREWIEVQTNGEEEQVPRAHAISFVTQNELYICSGNTKDRNQIPKRLILDNKVWRLNMSSMKWSCVGKLSPVINLNNLPFYDFISNNCKIYFLFDTFTEIDFNENSISIFDSKSYSGFSSAYLEGNAFVGILKDNNSKKNFFKVYPLNRYKGKLLLKSIFIEPLVYDYRITIGLVVLLTFSCIIIFFFWKKKRDRGLHFPGIIFNEKQQQFLYKSKQIMIFDEQEKKLLLYLMKQSNQFVSLNNLNQLFENNKQPETISATVKRRELVVSRLLTKVSKITGIDEEVLILEKKNSEDKRIKDLKILPNLIKKI